MFTEDANDPPAELPTASLEARLGGHIGRGEVTGLVGVTPLAQGTTSLVTPWLFPTGAPPSSIIALFQILVSPAGMRAFATVS